jgi:hypothetical protein
LAIFQHHVEKMEDLSKGGSGGKMKHCSLELLRRVAVDSVQLPQKPWMYQVVLRPDSFVGKPAGLLCVVGAADKEVCGTLYKCTDGIVDYVPAVYLARLLAPMCEESSVLLLLKSLSLHRR